MKIVKLSEEEAETERICEGSENTKQCENQ